MKTTLHFLGQRWPQEVWVSSTLPWYSYHVCVCGLGPSVVSDSLWPRGLWPSGLLCPWDSSQPRNWTRVSHITGRFFIVWATQEAQEYWSGWPIPSPGDLPNPEINPGSPVLQVDSLPAELPEKPSLYYCVCALFTGTVHICVCTYVYVHICVFLRVITVWLLIILYFYFKNKK